MRISGADSKLVRALELGHRADRNAARAPENYTYTKPEDLADYLHYEDVVAVRQRVSRCRAETQTMFQEVHGRKLPKGALIETRRPDGYRLNPQIRFVAYSEVPEDDALSHGAKKVVTKGRQRV